MRVVGTILLVVAAVLVQSANAVQACGDKFLMVGRGVSFHRAYAAVYPASIVVYAQPKQSAKGIRDPHFQDDLKRAGHRVLLVENDAALARALESTRVDLVLTDAVDADRVSILAKASQWAPAVLPVTYEPAKEAAKKGDARAPRQLKGADHVDRYLDTIDDTMKIRVAQKKKAS